MMRWRAGNRVGCFTGMVLPGFVKTVATFKGLKRTASDQRESGKAPCAVCLAILPDPPPS